MADVEDLPVQEREGVDEWSDGPSDPHLRRRCCHQTTGPRVDRFGPKQTRDPLLQGDATRLRKPDQQQTVVGPWRVLTGVREIEILGHQESAVRWCRAPHDVVVFTADALGRHGIDLVTEGCKEWPR